MLTFDHFLSDEECSNVIVESEPHMDSTGLSMNDRDRKKGSATKKYAGIDDASHHRGVGTAHQRPPGSVASYRMYADVRIFR